jgi:hypothetical protein
MHMCIRTGSRARASAQTNTTKHTHTHTHTHIHIRTRSQSRSRVWESEDICSGFVGHFCRREPEPAMGVGCDVDLCTALLQEITCNQVRGSVLSVYSWIVMCMHVIYVCVCACLHTMYCLSNEAYYIFYVCNVCMYVCSAHLSRHIYMCNMHYSYAHTSLDPNTNTVGAQVAEG